MSTVQKELEIAASQVDESEVIPIAEIKERVADLNKTVESGLESLQEAADTARDQVVALPVAEFYKILEELINKLKKGIPTMANELAMVLDYTQTQILSNKGKVDEYLRNFARELECDDKRNTAVDPKSGTLLRHALIKRIHRREHEVFYKLGRREKVVARELYGFDADGLWTAMSKKLRDVICMYIEELYFQAKKYIQVAAFYDDGHWKDLFRHVAADLVPKIDKAVAQAGPDSKGLDRKTLSDLMFSGLYNKAQNGPQNGPAGPQVAAAQAAMHKAMAQAMAQFGMQMPKGPLGPAGPSGSKQ